MRKFISLLTVLLILGSFFAPLTAFADGEGKGNGGIWDDFTITVNDNDGTATISAKDGQKSGFNGFVNKYKGLISILAVLAVITIVGTIVVNGVRFATSGANPQKRSEAKTALIYSLIGAAIVGVAGALAAFAYNIAA